MVYSVNYASVSIVIFGIDKPDKIELVMLEILRGNCLLLGRFE